MTIEDKNLKNS